MDLDAFGLTIVCFLGWLLLVWSIRQSYREGFWPFSMIFAGLAVPLGILTYACAMAVY